MTHRGPFQPITFCDSVIEEVCVHVHICLYTKMHIYAYIFLPSMVSCNFDLVSRLRMGYMVNTATDYVPETSTAQTNLSTSLHYIVKSTEDD